MRRWLVTVALASIVGSLGCGGDDGDDYKSSLLCKQHSECGEGWVCDKSKSRCQRALDGTYGVTADKLVLGMSAAVTTGPTELGQGMKSGIEAYFNHVNTQLGGVHGRQLELSVKNDGYEPAEALANMKSMVESKSVFAVMGNVGTPTAAVTVPYAVDQRMVFFGALTGAGLLRNDPPDRYVFNYRASYAQETEQMVRYFVDTREPAIPAQNIGVLPQGEDADGTMDSYGQSGFDGVAKALKSKANILKDDITYWTYTRNSADVKPAVGVFLKWLGDGNRPKDGDGKIHAAIAMVPTANAAAQFIKELLTELSGIARGDSTGAAYGLTTEEADELKNVDEVVFSSVSFVGSNALASALYGFGNYTNGAGKEKSFCEGTLVSQVVPHFESNSSGVIEYRDHLMGYDSNVKPGFVSLEGYLVGRLFVEALQKRGPDLSMEAFVDTLHSMNDINLGIGTNLSFSENRHQASLKVWGTELDGGCAYGAFDL